VEKKLINPYDASMKGYSYPSTFYHEYQYAYTGLKVDIFQKPNPNFIGYKNLLTGEIFNKTSLVIALIEDDIKPVQFTTIDEFLTKQEQIRIEILDNFIPFYNNALDGMTGNDPIWEQDYFCRIGGVALAKVDISRAEERIFLSVVGIPETGIFGDFYLEFDWNLDPEHTIVAQYKKFQFVDIMFMDEMNF
jgi:hypothetical protein